MYHNDDRTDAAITDLLFKLTKCWEPAHLTATNPLRPVSDIVRATQLSVADYAYLEREAPMIVRHSGDGIFVDYSLLISAHVLQLRGTNVEFSVQALRAWHLILLRSTFWTRFHEVYEPVGRLSEFDEHARALWDMVDPVYTTGSPPMEQPDAVKKAVVFRQILATRSELSDLHPIDAVARYCIPGYAEQVERYVQEHARAISQVFGLTV